MIQDRVPRVPLPAPRIMSLKPAQGKLCLGARGRRLKSRRDVAHLAHDFLQIRARSEALLLEASDFRFLTEQLLLEELDAAALVRALGLKQRILARPLGGRPLGHLSSRKAGSSAHGWSAASRSSRKRTEIFVGGRARAKKKARQMLEWSQMLDQKNPPQLLEMTSSKECVCMASGKARASRRQVSRLALILRQSSPLPHHLQFRQISLAAFAELLQPRGESHGAQLRR